MPEEIKRSSVRTVLAFGMCAAAATDVTMDLCCSESLLATLSIMFSARVAHEVKAAATTEKKARMTGECATRRR